MDSNSSNSSCGSSSKLNNDSGKKSWSELKATVNDLRRQMTNLSSMFPMNVNFRKLTDGRTRIYFLSTPPNSFDTTLLFCDIAGDSAEISDAQNPIR
jgi:dipeptidyl-peptidase 9